MSKDYMRLETTCLKTVLVLTLVLRYWQSQDTVKHESFARHLVSLLSLRGDDPRDYRGAVVKRTTVTER